MRAQPAGKRWLSLFAVVAPVMLWCLSGRDPFLNVLAVTSVVASILVLWRPGMLPILVLPVALQLGQVVAKPAYALLTAAPLEGLSQLHVDLRPAAYLGLAGVVALAVGLRAGAGRRAIAAPLEASLTPARSFWICLALVLAGRFLIEVSYGAGPLRQLLSALAYIEYVGLFVLAFTCFQHRRGYQYLAMVMLIEILGGMMNFFGGFKEAFYVLALALICSRPKFGGKEGATLVTLIVGLALLSIFWTAVKPDYRNYLNRGTGRQVVERSLGERLTYVQDRAANLDSLSLGPAAKATVYRLSYIDYLAITMQRVPRVLPHTDGALVGAAAMHVLTPRILFPNKAALPSDSELTNRYTGLRVASGNTSISIGYLGELYIDFGWLGAVIGALLLGVVLGFCFRSVVSVRGLPSIWRYAFGVALLLQCVQFEKALTKTLGGIIMTYLVFLLIERLWVSTPFRSPAAGTLPSGRAPPGPSPQAPLG